MAKEKKLHRLTLEQLIAASDKREAALNKTEEIEIPQLGGTLLFKRPSDRDMLSFVNRVNAAGEDDVMEITVDEMARIIYTYCDELHDKGLYEELEVGDPIDVVHKIMDAGDIMTVGDKVCSMNSIYGNAAEEIKNG